jgi:hypothetical protein
MLFSQKILKLWNERPLLIIILSGLFVRILAAIFAQGYGMHDDHFGPIEQPFLILTDPSFWASRGEPHGHSIFYPSLHYLLFSLFNSFGLSDPKLQMFIVRLLHAAYSMITVYYGYKIAVRISGEKNGSQIGLILSLLWFLPFMSVRNLIEMVCIPPLMAGLWLSLKENKKDLFIAGLLFGFAFIFRYQTAIIPFGIGLVLLFRKDFLKVAILLSGTLTSILLVQGSADLFAWGYPLAAPITYFKYNATHGTDYIVGPWYQYLALLAGFLIPPVSLFIFRGFFNDWRKHLILIVPIFLFIFFHSYFPNKQERFIFPVIPVFLVVGMSGWYRYIERSAFWDKHKRLLKNTMIWFWIVNTILLALMTFSYGKRSRCESMYYLRNHQDVTSLYISGGTLGPIKPPLFYLGRNINVYSIDDSANVLKNENDSKIKETVFVKPNYIVFFGKDDLVNRIIEFKKITNSRLEFLSEQEPSFIDNILYKLNPRGNKNTSAFIYKISYQGQTQ